MRTHVILLLLVTLAAGCSWQQGNIARNLDTCEAMRADVLNLVPPGMTVIEATRVMERSGFSVERKNQNFNTDEFTRAAFDHLLCRRTDKAGAGQVRCWQVALEIHDNQITDALVRISYTGR